MKGNYTDKQKVNDVYSRVENLRSLYTHAVIYVIVNAAIYCASLNGLGLPDTFWKTSQFVTGVFAGIAVLGHWAGVIGYRYIFPEKKESALLERFVQEEDFR